MARGGARSTSWKAGFCPNPGGRPKKAASVEAARIIADVKALAKAESETAIRTLVDVMKDAKAPPAARVGAANSILDRGWGKPQQTVEANVNVYDRMSDEELRAIVLREIESLAVECSGQLESLEGEP